MKKLLSEATFLAMLLDEYPSLERVPRKDLSAIESISSNLGSLASSLLRYSTNCSASPS